jgi:hypothetical protein
MQVRRYERYSLESLVKALYVRCSSCILLGGLVCDVGRVGASDLHDARRFTGSIGMRMAG